MKLKDFNQYINEDAAAAAPAASGTTTSGTGAGGGAYATLTNTNGMGAVSAPQPGSTPGAYGTKGSGDMTHSSADEDDDNKGPASKKKPKKNNKKNKDDKAFVKSFTQFAIEGSTYNQFGPNLQAFQSKGSQINVNGVGAQNGRIGFEFDGDDQPSGGEVKRNVKDTLEEPIKGKDSSEENKDKLEKAEKAKKKKEAKNSTEK